MPADEYGLMRLVAGRGPQVTATVEMMSGAAWIADALRGAGRQVNVADARRARALAPLAAKTDKIDARVLARRDLVPEVWVPALGDRADLELLLRRIHLIRLRTSAKNRIFGLLTQWGVRSGVAHLRTPGAIDELAGRGVLETWRDSIAEAVAVIELLDRRLEPIDERLLEVARADDRARLLRTIPGVGWLLGLTFAVEIGDVSRFSSAGKLVGYSGLVPHVDQSGERSRTGRLSRAGSPLLRARPTAPGWWGRSRAVRSTGRSHGSGRSGSCDPRPLLRRHRPSGRRRRPAPLPGRAIRPALAHGHDLDLGR